MRNNVYNRPKRYQGMTSNEFEIHNLSEAQLKQEHALIIEKKSTRGANQRKLIIQRIENPTPIESEAKQ